MAAQLREGLRRARQAGRWRSSTPAGHAAGLVDECPVVPRSLAEEPGASLRVTTEFEFISENAQIEWARDFVDSLPVRLAASSG